MLRLVKIFRFLLFLIIALVVIVPTVLYVVVSTDWAQDRLRTVGENELSALLGTRVEIGKIYLQLPNTLGVSSVAVADDNDSTALHIDHIETRFELWDFLLHDKLIIDYATINGLDLKLYKADKEAPLNIDGIVQRLSKKDDTSPPSIFRLRLNDVSLNGCSISYDVWSEPQTPGRFNPSHVRVSDFDLTAFAPTLANDEYHVLLSRLAFKEASGLELKRLSCELDLTPHQVQLTKLVAEMPNSLVNIGDLDIPIDGFEAIKGAARDWPLTLTIDDGTHIFLPDFKAFAPTLNDIDYDLALSTQVTLSGENLNIAYLKIHDTGQLINVDVKGDIHGLKDMANAAFDNFDFEVRLRPAVYNTIMSQPALKLSPKARDLISNLGNTDLKGSASGKLSDARVDIDLSSALAKASVVGKYTKLPGHNHYDLALDAEIDSIKLGKILDNADFNQFSGAVSLKGVLSDTKFTGDVSADVSKFDYKGHRYSDITATGSMADDQLSAKAEVVDRYAWLEVDFVGSNDNGRYTIDGTANINRLNTDSLNIKTILTGLDFSATARLNMDAYSIDDLNGTLSIDDLHLTKADGRSLYVNSIDIKADNMSRFNHIWINSDYIDGSINGQYNMATIGKSFKRLFSKILPALAPEYEEDEEPFDYDTQPYNRFAFDFTFADPDLLCEFFDLPVHVIDEANIFGNYDERDLKSFLCIEMPWIIQGNKVIEGTTISAHLDGTEGTGVIYGTTKIPTKKGDMELVATIHGKDGALSTNIDWEIVRTIPINGNVNFLTNLYKTESGLGAKVDFDFSQINFGGEMWDLNKSDITYEDGLLKVNNFGLSSLTQRITVNGVGGPGPDDVLVVNLKDIQLINIFETLEIDNALISGYATGTITAKGLLGKKPEIKSEDLKIRDIGYNYCTLGDANANLNLENDGKLFAFDAVVTEPGGLESYLYGSINIPGEALDLNIKANKIKVGFMKPFMSAFTSDVKGYASGNAHLFGTFKDIDLTGDIQADSLRIKIDFTNTWYSANDSVHIFPGRIDLKNIVLYDEFNNTALLNGWVKHEYFHNATFDFNITNANDFLCYDEVEKRSPDWYGRIFGNGSASVRGGPGMVNISVNMTTASNSIFTFVLSDQKEAADYSFITFRDVTQRKAPDPIINRDITPEKVRRLMEKTDNTEESNPTAYVMDIVMDLTPQAQIIIVMDPIGGDRIRAYGRGNMRMKYNSRDNDLWLYGTYKLDRGSYNFTLQDIIIKDFTIKNGSSIKFNGDPYSAQLDINAFYQVNANLSDLDESFLQDKELNRTNVPVRALMHVTGDMRQPDIEFDLEFPTFTNQDTYNKVKAIISTEDMMNKQIIYLLALNRFYTPEYMGTTSKGNEIFSVASSTISSQLSSMLGKLSDNWSIAPNLRSENGDFSDLEVDLTLSSSLLNNRLLFNGNFGYRDKSLNTNQFVGDFDIEYLLNRSGAWRLKAYNRYNDQNYYLRTAQTTQGVGLVYRRDFDKFLGFLKTKPQTTTDTDTVKPNTSSDSIYVKETIQININDTIK